MTRILIAKQLFTIIIMVMLALQTITVMGKQAVSVTRSYTDSNERDDDIIELDGHITATIGDGYLLTVSPCINISDQKVEITTVKDDDEFYVDSLLKINIDVQGNRERRSLFKTHCILFISISRNIRERVSFKSLVSNAFFIFPLTIYRINVLSDGDKYVDIPLQHISTESSENVSLNILAIGTPSCLLSKNVPFISFEKVNMEFVYSETDYVDTTPPVTTYELDGNLLR